MLTFDELWETMTTEEQKVVNDYVEEVYNRRTKNNKSLLLENAVTTIGLVVATIVTGHMLWVKSVKAT